MSGQADRGSLPDCSCVIAPNTRCAVHGYLTGKPPEACAALMHHVAAVGSALCQYLPGHGDSEKWPSSRCDCKYGLSGIGEETGCPEMRTLYRRLHMDAEFAPFLGLARSDPEDTHA